MKSKLKNIVYHLKIRKGMYLLDKNSYSSLASFLIGFSLGISEQDKNILDDFHDWLQVREEKNFSLNWSSYILNELCNGNEKKAGELTLELMEDFTNDVEWSKKYPIPRSR
ncbi:hypothetical protein [Aquimarina sp. 2201CG14-23]|uniref:hypothetical protein n=1 Tax=Aquimarina mycalae TaxID=3040073 RepID=UPI0024780389|nr:hypothetical protein [Aquimarina sp. 2201CG14-23]MDH7447318.1 hypothetical protein [Aquimarina sp. 2201CG14-23]